MPLDLDAVDWASLSHAYGPAEDVPGLIRDLRSPDKQVRQDAMFELCGNIYHQGSRYEASAHAAPFLLELVADPTTPARHEIVALLTCLAVGDDRDFAATGFPVTALREAAAGVPESTRQRWTQLMKQWQDLAMTGERTPLPLTKDEQRRHETCHELAAYDAVRAGVPVLVDLLADHDDGVVGEAIHALAWFPEEAAAIQPGLVAICADERQPVEIASAALVALGLLTPRRTPEVERLLNANLLDPEPHLQWSAAIAWAHIARDEVSAAVIAELRTWAACYQTDTERCVWDTSRAALALRMLDQVAVVDSDEIRVELATAALGAPADSDRDNRLGRALACAFAHGDSARDTPFSELTSAQQLVLAWLIDNPHVFNTGEPHRELIWRGLPTTLDALRAYVE